MSIDADTLRRLAALDLPKEAFQEVLSILADVQAKSEARRKAAQERTAKWREGQKRHGDAAVTSPERHGDCHDPSSLSSSGEQERKEEALGSARPREASRGPKRPVNGHSKPAGVVIRFDSPQARAWERHNGKSFAWGQRGERTVPTEWPPGHDPPGSASNGLETHPQEQ